MLAEDGYMTLKVQLLPTFHDGLTLLYFILKQKTNGTTHGQGIRQ